MEATVKKALLFCMLALLASVAQATPANTPILDGRPIDYDSANSFTLIAPSSIP